VTAEAYHHYGDLHRLVDRLRPDQADEVRAVVLQLVASADTGSGNLGSGDSPQRSFLFAGSMSAEPDFAERSEEILDEIVRRNAG
jgi:hypothetical protein